jgi:hypothetical protein
MAARRARPDGADPVGRLEAERPQLPPVPGGKPLPPEPPAPGRAAGGISWKPFCRDRWRPDDRWLHPRPDGQGVGPPRAKLAFGSDPLNFRARVHP